jgi:nucleotide-binding universal stress UspA family protein
VVPPAPVAGAGDAAVLGGWAWGALAPAAVYDAAAAEAERAAAREYLESVATGLRSRGHAVRVAVESGPAAATIVDYARQQAVGAIALATHGRGGLGRLVLGSVAYETARRAAVPLLLMRPAALR